MIQTRSICKLLTPRMCRVMSYIHSIFLSTGFVTIVFFTISTHHIFPYNISNIEKSNETTTGTEISGLTNDNRSQKTIRNISTSGTGSVVTNKKETNGIPHVSRANPLTESIVSRVLTQNWVAKCSSRDPSRRPNMTRHINPSLTTLE